MEADTSFCSTAKRLPPPCPGIPISVHDDVLSVSAAAAMIAIIGFRTNLGIVVSFGYVLLNLFT